MIYNKLGKSNLKVSRLGFGTMRLPTINSNADIDEPVAKPTKSKKSTNVQAVRTNKKK